MRLDRCAETSITAASRDRFGDSRLAFSGIVEHEGALLHVEFSIGLEDMQKVMGVAEYVLDRYEVIMN